MARSFAAKTGGSGPVSHRAKSDARIALARHGLDGTAVPSLAMHSTPQPITPLPEPIPALLHFTRMPFGTSVKLLDMRPETLLNSGRKNPAPVASTGGRSGHFGTLWERPAGTQTHSRRTGRKLGQLRYARQGLVRVSESNTKYGGKGGKTGAMPRP
jgi:hypothetical protein